MTEMSPAEAVFFAALEKDPADRSAYLDAACAGKPDLRARVEKLLAAHPKVGDFLEPPSGAGGGRQPPDTIDHQGADAPRSPDRPTGTFARAHPSLTADDPGRDQQAGTVIAGKYTLVEPVGEGGMGSVWRARQTDPVKRFVAVKLIKVGMDSRQVLARFEAERQALALMDHPHIAKVLDGGVHAGRPFFVMELVKGVPITTFCDAHRLTVPDRLRLFQQVCSAVQHAHQKGVIHRDLKPGNVLVESHDGKPVPKVIDFGLAKAAGGLRLTDATLFTGFGAVLGTPQYMAPEQATFNAVDVDTRADVYALGVILYELLAGSPPLGRETLKKAALEEMLRAIREDDPPPPSSRIGGSAERPSLAAARQTEPDKLGRFVRGELDWIVMKALAKDRDRRYDTATAFGADVGRFLNHEPVAAGPPGAGYRLRKFVSRNRGPVAAAAAVLLALTVGIAGTTTGLVRAERARSVAETAEQNEREERQKADAARKEADEHRKVAERQAISARIDIDRSGWTGANNRGWSRWQEAEEFRAHWDEVEGVHTPPYKVFIDQHTGSGRGLAILRLAATHRTIPDHARDLREYAAMAVLAWGQQFAPLVPELTHDGREVTNLRVGPDGRTVLTGDADGSVRLWDAPTGRLHAALRRSGERVMYAGFSRDGRTVVTDDEAGVVRLWDASTGAHRAELPARPDRVIRSGRVRKLWSGSSVKCDGDRVLTYREWWAGPFELWDAKTGHLVARLDLSGFRPRGGVEFVAGGRWIVASVFEVRRQSDATDPVVQNNAGTAQRPQPERVEVFSAADGRWLARLNGAGYIAAVSPTGSRLVTVGLRDDGQTPRVWDPVTWQPDPTAPSIRGRSPINYLSDDLFMYGTDDPIPNLPSETKSGLYQHGRPGPHALVDYAPAVSITSPTAVVATLSSPRSRGGGGPCQDG
ncbi:MAG: protein kinase, partial [Gemmataceae bacterium]|nr:protein kinase [Gemmataceae bacterium]